MKRSWVLIIPIIIVMISSCALAMATHASNAPAGDHSLGMEAYNKGEYTKAISYYKKAIESDPESGAIFHMLGLAYIGNKQYDEAITATKRAIELIPDNAPSYYNLGVAYGNKKQYDEAIKNLQKAVDIDPKMANAYGWLGTYLVETNAYSEAAEAYKKGIEAEPSKDNLYPLLAAAYCLMGEYDNAVAAANKAIELNVPVPGGVGIIVGIKKNYPVVLSVINTGPAKKSGIQVEDKILKVDGESTEGWNIEHIVQKLRGATGTQVTLIIERPGIDKQLEKLINREGFVSPVVANIYGVRSLSYRYKGNQEESLHDAEKAYSLDPANTWAQLSLGASYLDRGNPDEAIKLLSQVKGAATARILEATAYAKLEKPKEAVDIYLSIPEEELSPKNIPQTNDRMAFLRLMKPFEKKHRDKARSFETKGMNKEALSELSEALKTVDETDAQAIRESIFGIVRKNPSLSEMSDDARKYSLRGAMLAKDGDFIRAAPEFKKAVQIAPYSAQLYFNSALIYAELKKYPEAIRYMKIYLQAAPDAPNARAVKDEIIKWELMLEKGETF